MISGVSISFLTFKIPVQQMDLLAVITDLMGQLLSLILLTLSQVQSTSLLGTFPTQINGTEVCSNLPLWFMDKDPI